MIFNAQNKVSPKLIKSGRFTNLSMLITGKIKTKIHTKFLTPFEGVTTSQKFIFNAKNEVSPKLLKSGGFTHSNVLITEKITEKTTNIFNAF